MRAAGGEAFGQRQAYSGTGAGNNRPLPGPFVGGISVHGYLLWVMRYESTIRDGAKAGKGEEKQKSGGAVGGRENAIAQARTFALQPVQKPAGPDELSG